MSSKCQLNLLATIDNQLKPKKTYFIRECERRAAQGDGRRGRKERKLLEQLPEVTG